jgi:hypothetical protein
MVLVYLCPLDLTILGILLGERYYNWHMYACGLFCLASGPPTVDTVTGTATMSSGGIGHGDCVQMALSTRGAWASGY